MKMNLLLILMAVAILMTGCSTPKLEKNGWDALPEITTIIGNKKITKEELYNNAMMLGASSKMPALELAKQIEKKIIQRTFLIKLAEKKGYTKKYYTDEFDRKFNGMDFESSSRLNEGLKKRGLTLEQYKKNAIAERIAKMFVLNEIYPTLRLNKKSIQSFYLKNKQRLFQKLTASHILIKSKNKAEELLQQIKSGADFAELAKENSECPSAKKGGELPSFAIGEFAYFLSARMDPKFVNATENLKVGEISDIVESPFGFHIIKLNKKDYFKLDNKIERIIKQLLVQLKIDDLIKENSLKVRIKSYI